MEIEEARLPGVGTRYELRTDSGRRVGVVARRDGMRELVVYDEADVDACSERVELSESESDALAELLGAPRIVERLSRLREVAADLVTESIPLPPETPYVGRTLGDTRARTRTGASIVAVVRASEVLASPRPDFRFQAGDRVLVVGTSAALREVARLLQSG